MSMTTATRERHEHAQRQESEWAWQWSHLQGEEGQSESLFWEWVLPLGPKDFRGKKVLDAGCGGGHMLGYVHGLVKEGVGIDLNTAALVQQRFRGVANIRVEEGDAAVWDAESDFDIVYSIGVVHHTQDPEKTARNLMQRVKPGGKLALWVYGHEGNFWTRMLVEKPKVLYRWMPRWALWLGSMLLTLLLYPIIWTIYLLPLTFLPFYEYFQNWRRLSFWRNCVNVFDKLNAPTTHFIKRGDIDRWFEGMPYHNIQVTSWCGLSWRVSATRNR